jgi:hypothetical protein
MAPPPIRRPFDAGAMLATVARFSGESLAACGEVAAMTLAMPSTASTDRRSHDQPDALPATLTAIGIARTRSSTAA